MYDIKLAKDEEIILISDNTMITSREGELYSSIITNQRFIILADPSSFHNSREELRILNKMNYVKMKEIIFEIPLKNIKKVENDQIIFTDGSITIKDKDITTKLYDIIK